MPSYVEIAVNLPQVSGGFHYHLPPEMEGRVAPGHLVEVPFGKQRVQGVVLRAVAEPAVAETRAVLELIDPEVVLTLPQLALVEYLSESTLAPLSACISLMLPAGLNQMADVCYQISNQYSGISQQWKTGSRQPVTAAQKRLLDVLGRRGPLLGRQIDRALPHLNWRAASRLLIRRGLILTNSVLPPPSVQPKSVHTAQLACPPQAIESHLPNLGRVGTKALARRQAILRFLQRETGPVEVSWVYAESGGNLADLHFLAERGLVSLGESQVWRDPLAGLDFLPLDPPQLTKEQATAWEAIRSGMQAAVAGRFVPPFLLHGVTGSGKTEIYLQAVAEAIHSGRQAIILVPEIALTPQTVRRFLSRFPGQVGLVHSGLLAGERYDTWRRARLGQLGVVVGPRSALFTPMPALGLIVVDECHDDSYYQGEGLPYYHARQAAVAYARLAGAVCLLGSATPDLVSRFQANQGSYQSLHLPERILAHRQAVQAQMERLALQGQPSRYRPLENQAETADLPPVSIVDMRLELKAGNRSIFSRALQQALRRVLDNKQQAILFLNRRGMATYVFCRDCGQSLLCPRCDTPLTYHNSFIPQGVLSLAGAPGLKTNASPQTRQGAALTCHHCGYQRKMPKSCPSCGSAHIRQYGTGTERVEAAVQEMFPQARTLRWDYETTRKKGAHDLILSHFITQRADVLIGTQMLAKGLDLPLVTLVGVVLADVGLNLPDYHAAERTFQVLTQVAGRAGRSPLGGEVILQTFQPDHYVIQAAAGHDYAGFYARELEHRRQLGYPPFNQLVRLEFRHVRSSQAESAAKELAAQIDSWLETSGRRATQLIGPVPCFYARLNGLYRWQIILRGPDPASLLRGRQLANWRIEVNPPNLL